METGKQSKRFHALLPFLHSVLATPNPKPQTLNPETTSKPSLRSDDRLHAMEFPLVVGEEVLRTFRVVGNLQVEADGLGFWAWVFGVV